MSSPDLVFIRLDQAHDQDHTKTVRLVLDNFLREIEDNEEDNTKYRVIKSPEFEIAGYKLRVDVYPKCEPGFTGIYLHNKNDVDLTASFSFEVHFQRSIFIWIIFKIYFQLLGETDEIKKATLEKNGDFGTPDVMSHDVFKAWAEEKKDDSLDILATVTLHLTNQADKETKWITGRLVKLSVC